MSLAMASAGVSIVGGAIGAAGNMKSGKAARAIADYNAQIQERNAKIQEQAAQRKLFMQDVENVQFRQEAAKFLEGVGVSYRKSGVIAGTDTPLLVALESANNADEDIEKSKMNARVEALRLKENATGMRLQAGLTRIEGRFRQQQYQAKAFSSLLGGASKAYQSYKLG